MVNVILSRYVHSICISIAGMMSLLRIWENASRVFFALRHVIPVMHQQAAEIQPRDPLESEYDTGSAPDTEREHLSPVSPGVKNTIKKPFL